MIVVLETLDAYYEKSEFRIENAYNELTDSFCIKAPTKTAVIISILTLCTLHSFFLRDVKLLKMTFKCVCKVYRYLLNLRLLKAQIFYFVFEKSLVQCRDYVTLLQDCTTST